MCANYSPAKRARLEKLLFGLASPEDDPPHAEVFPSRLAPALLNAHRDRWTSAMFGLVPHWADPVKIARMTYNARVETVAEKPSFRNAWRRRQFCVIPADAFFEPCYESGRAVRWRIERADGEAMMFAGIWEERPQDTGSARWSFSMLTVNADAHPVLRRFHKPTDEKRRVVILDQSFAAEWLDCRDLGHALALLNSPVQTELICRPDPIVRGQLAPAANFG